MVTWEWRLISHETELILLKYLKRGVPVALLTRRLGDKGS